MSGAIPAVLRDLIDDAAVFPPGNAPLEEAVPAHRGHRQSWYATMVGALLIPASRLHDLAPSRTALRIGVIVDVEPEQVSELVGALDESIAVVQYESRAALHHLEKAAVGWGAPIYAELPFGEEGLDAVVGTGFTPKFRTGGLFEEFFPSPRTLAEVIVGCAERGLRFKLTAGLHRAIRHRDPETGFVHHGFLNVLAASAEASAGAPVAEVAELLASTDTEHIVHRVRAIRDVPRPLWVGFGSCSIIEPLQELTALSLVTRGGTES
ncbi:hypothetical protein L0U85_12390 [Glycomyces sp. L485]|uniref:hypothetical protein n=1 Tax=Glycomyces sp. L485 TaxID=2909235 RepID=UPI001F4A4C5F|nr:hypothetical protein [Glycomyces sp. L485]MCH7231644.1 hypothetical protein [Glycomyces sp. L485]